MTVNKEYVAQLVRSHLKEKTGRSSQGLHRQIFLYNRADKVTNALRLRRKEIEEMLIKLEEKLGIFILIKNAVNIRVIPGSLNYTRTNIGDLIDYIVRRCDQEKIYLTSKFNVYKDNNVDVSDVVETKEIDNSIPSTITANTVSDDIGAIVVLKDDEGNRSYISYSSTQNSFVSINGFVNASILDPETIMCAFQIVEEVLHVNTTGDSELGSFVDRLIRHEVEHGKTLSVGIIQLNEPEQFFEFAPDNSMEEIEKRLTPELRTYLREKLNENRTSEAASRESSQKTNKS